MRPAGASPGAAVLAKLSGVPGSTGKSGAEPSKFADLLESRADAERFVPRALALLEADFRELALAALSDWERLGIVSPDLFLAIAGLQRPSWGSWNGLLGALRNARKSVVRSGAPPAREAVEKAATLGRVLALLDEGLDPGLVAELRPLADLTRTPLSGRTRLGALLALPITLRNRIAHDTPTDAAWWETTAAALAPLVRFHAREAKVAAITGSCERRSPWFSEEGGEVATFNGLGHDFAVVYVSRSGATRHSAERGQEALIAFQRLLGKTESQERDFKKLLSKLAPEDVKGVVMGDFLVGRPVGEGGFATVHVGRQLSTGRKVAIKILRDGLPEDAKARFQHEAAYLSKFNHPSIVGVLGYGEDTWSAPRAFSLSEEAWFESFSKSAPVKSWIALEWVDGKTLEEVYRTGAERPGHRVLAIWFAEAAGALALVHASGLVHRDVKPGNLMVASDGSVKLMDFGIARSQGEARTIVTGSGQAIGTPAYMSPEQVRAQDADAAVGPSSDIYSLCATFYELFTAARLFGHDTLDARTVETKKLSGELPELPRRRAPGLAWELDTILMGGLQHEVADRYASMAALERDIRHFLRDEPIEYRRPSIVRRLRLGYRRNRLVANLVAGFLVAAGLGTALYVRDIGQKKREVEKNLAEAKHNLARILREKADRALADTDAMAAEVLYARSLAIDDDPVTRRQHQVARERGARLVFATPCEVGAGLVALAGDGRRLATAQERAGLVSVFDLTTGHEERVLSVPRVEALAIDGAGARLACASPQGLRVLDLASGRELASFSTRGVSLEALALDAAGERAVGVDAEGNLLVFSVAEKRRVARFPGTAPITSLALAGDGRSVVWSEGQALLRRDLSLPGEPSVVGSRSSAIVALAASRDGSRVATATAAGSVVVSRGGEERTFAIDDGKLAAVALDAAGGRLAVAGARHVHVLDAAGGVEPLSLDLEGATALALSDDGRTLVAGSDAAGPRVLDLSVAGGRLVARERLSPRGHRGGISTLAFTPDGEHLVSGGYDGTLRVWDAAGREERTLSRSSEAVTCADITSDGKTLVAGTAGGRLDVWDLATGAFERAIEGQGYVKAVAIYPYQRFVFSAGSGVRFANIDTGESAAYVTTLTIVAGLGFTTVRQSSGNAREEDPEHPRLVVARGTSLDLIEILERDVHALFYPYGPHGTYMTGAAVSPAPGEYVALRRSDGLVYAVSLARERVESFRVSDVGTGIALDPDANVVIGEAQARVRGQGGEPILVLSGHTTPPAAVAVSPDGTRIATGDGNGAIRVFERGCAAGRRIASVYDATARTVAADDELRQVVLAEGGGLRCVDGKSGEERFADLRARVGTYENGYPEFDGVSFSAAAVAHDGRRAYAFASGRSVRVVDLETLAAVGTLVAARDRAAAAAVASEQSFAQTVQLALTSDDRVLVEGRWDGVVVRFDLASGRELPPLDLHEPIRDLTPSPDGRELAVATERGNVIVIDLSSGRERRARGAGATVYLPGGLAWSPDGRRLAWKAHGEAVEVHDAATLEEIAALPGDASWLGFVGPERLLASRDSPGRELRLVDSRTGETLIALGGARGLAVSRDGAHVLLVRDSRIVLLDRAELERSAAMSPADLERESSERTGLEVVDLDAAPRAQNRLVPR